MKTEPSNKEVGLSWALQFHQGWNNKTMINKKRWRLQESVRQSTNKRFLAKLRRLSKVLNRKSLATLGTMGSKKQQKEIPRSELENRTQRIWKQGIQRYQDQASGQSSPSGDQVSSGDEQIRICILNTLIYLWGGSNICRKSILHTWAASSPKIK